LSTSTATTMPSRRLDAHEVKRGAPSPVLAPAARPWTGLV
jgi:hypothetical protein